MLAQCLISSLYSTNVNLVVHLKGASFFITLAFYSRRKKHELLKKQVPATKRQWNYSSFSDAFILIALLCVGILKKGACQGSVIIQFQLQ